MPQQRQLFKDSPTDFAEVAIPDGNGNLLAMRSTLQSRKGMRRAWVFPGAPIERGADKPHIEPEIVAAGAIIRLAGLEHEVEVNRYLIAHRVRFGPSASTHERPKEPTKTRWVFPVADPERITKLTISSPVISDGGSITIDRFPTYYPEDEVIDPALLGSGQHADDESMFFVHSALLEDVYGEEAIDHILRNLDLSPDTRSPLFVNEIQQ